MRVKEERRSRGGFWSRFEQVPGQQRSRPVRNGVIISVILGLLLYAGFTRQIPGLPDGRETVSAHFERSLSLQPGNPVRLRGVDVGEVEKIELGPDREGAMVTMRLDGDYDLDLRADARADLYWRMMVGRNLYIELDPGTDEESLGSGTIALDQTTTQVEFDDLLRPFDGDGRRGGRAFIRAFERGLRDPEPPRETLDELAPAMAATEAGLPALRGTETGDLTRLVRNSARTMGALARAEGTLPALIDSGAVTLGVTAARRADLGELLREAPEAQREIQRTMVRLVATLDELDPLAEAMRPGARALDDAVIAIRPALDQATPLLRRTRPLLNTLKPSFVDLARAGRAGVPLFRELDGSLDRSEQSLVPWLEQRDEGSDLRNLEAVGPWFSGASAVASRYDANGFLLRVQPGAGVDSLDFLPCQLYLTNPSVDELARCDALNNAVGGILGGRPPAAGGKG